jgi:hypothetical protein
MDESDSDSSNEEHSQSENSDKSAESNQLEQVEQTEIKDNCELIKEKEAAANFDNKLVAEEVSEIE